MPLTQDQTDFVNARAKVVELCQADLTPVLTYSASGTNDPDVTKEVDEILSRNKRASRWLAGTVYKVNDVVMPTTRTGHRFRCVQGGTSGATEPLLFTEANFWLDEIQVIGGKLTDGTSDPILIWKEDGTDYENIYDVRTAVHECWILKASKAASKNQSISDGRGQASDYLYLNCLKMADRFAPFGVV